MRKATAISINCDQKASKIKGKKHKHTNTKENLRKGKIETFYKHRKQAVNNANTKQTKRFIKKAGAYIL